MTPDPDTMAEFLAEVAAEAGRFLACVSDRMHGHTIKPDGSPASAADIEAERMILARLATAYPDIPVLAEESGTGAHDDQDLFFLVDPLDGTRDFVSGAGEYSVNVALVQGRRPIAAALAVPPLDRVWAAGTRARCTPLGPGGTVPVWTEVRCRAPQAAGLVALVSRRHGDDETERCLGDFTIGRRDTVSSAAKFGLIASGEADLYVRCGPTMEWDTAAGDHIVTCAGGRVVGCDGQALTYGHPERGYRNGPFAAAGDPAVAVRVALTAR